jgi:hypothetical protein
MADDPTDVDIFNAFYECGQIDTAKRGHSTYSQLLNGDTIAKRCFVGIGFAEDLG